MRMILPCIVNTSVRILVARDIMIYRWSILEDDISGRGGREVMVLISEWNTDKLQNIDLNNPYLHQEPLGLLARGSVVDFTSLVTLGMLLSDI